MLQLSIDSAHRLRTNVTFEAELFAMPLVPYRHTFGYIVDSNLCASHYCNPCSTMPVIRTSGRSKPSSQARTVARNSTAVPENRGSPVADKGLSSLLHGLERRLMGVYVGGR